MDHGGDLEILRRGLVGQFGRGRDVAQRAHGVGAAGGDRIGRFAGALQALGQSLHGRGAVGAGVVQVDARAEQAVELDVATQFVVGAAPGHHAGQHQFAGETQLRRGGGGLAHVVRLHAAGGDHRVGATGQGFGQQEFQLARLVAAEAEPRAVVALDQEARASKRFGQARQGLQRRRQVGETPARNGVQGGEGRRQDGQPCCSASTSAWIARSIMRQASSASPQRLIFTHLSGSRSL